MIEISKIKENVDLKELEKFGFVMSNKIIYPKCLERIEDIKLYTRIYCDIPCINIWDGEDKNHTREIWVEDDNSGRGTCNNKEVIKYIEDLIQAGIVEVVEK